MLFTLIGGLCSLAAFVCWVILLIAAFRDEIWKGVVGFLCGIYLLYYGIVEFQHPQKWPIVLTYLIGGIVAGMFYRMGGAMMGSHGSAY